MPAPGKPRLRWPTIEAIATAIRVVNRTARPDTDDGIDVRLQVYPDGQWSLRWGPSDFDLDHRGYWGSSSVPGWNHQINARAIARDLKSQAQEQHATSADDGGDE